MIKETAAARYRSSKPAPTVELLRLRRRLRQASRAIFRRIECDYLDGVAILRGEVPSYYAKQLAQALLLTDPAVDAIENHLEVIDPDPGRRNGA